MSKKALPHEFSIKLDEAGPSLLAEAFPVVDEVRLWLTSSIFLLDDAGKTIAITERGAA